jgi:hypothetical protein
MELYAGLDLHSRNTYIGIMDKTFNRVFKKMKKGTSYISFVKHKVKNFKKLIISTRYKIG